MDMTHIETQNYRKEGIAPEMGEYEGKNKS